MGSTPTKAIMAKKQPYFKLTVELDGGIPTVTGFVPVTEWHWLVEATPSRLVFMSSQYKNILRTADMLMSAGVPQPRSAIIEYHGPYAKSY